MSGLRRLFFRQVSDRAAARAVVVGFVALTGVLGYTTYEERVNHRPMRLRLTDSRLVGVTRTEWLADEIKARVCVCV